jgi:hypothetical protein
MNMNQIMYDLAYWFDFSMRGAQSSSRLRDRSLGRFSCPSIACSKHDETLWHNKLWPSCGYGHSLRGADILSGPSLRTITGTSCDGAML